MGNSQVWHTYGRVQSSKCLRKCYQIQVYDIQLVQAGNLICSNMAEAKLSPGPPRLVVASSDLSTDGGNRYLGM